MLERTDQTMRTFTDVLIKSGVERSRRRACARRCPSECSAAGVAADKIARSVARMHAAPLPCNGSTWTDVRYHRPPDGLLSAGSRPRSDHGRDHAVAGVLPAHRGRGVAHQRAGQAGCRARPLEAGRDGGGRQRGAPEHPQNARLAELLDRAAKYASREIDDFWRKLVESNDIVSKMERRASRARRCGTARYAAKLRQLMRGDRSRQVAAQRGARRRHRGRRPKSSQA